MPTHIPVLLHETVDNLVTEPSGIYVDGTFGGGGHTRYLLETWPAARVIAFDRDPEAVERGRELARLMGRERLQIIHGSFADVAQQAVALAPTGEEPTPLVLGVMTTLRLIGETPADPPAP